MTTLNETARREGMPGEFIEDLENTLDAARAMLAALEKVERHGTSHGVGYIIGDVLAAIAQAKAAGIKGEG